MPTCSDHGDMYYEPSKGMFVCKTCNREQDLKSEERIERLFTLTGFIRVSLDGCGKSTTNTAAFLIKRCLRENGYKDFEVEVMK